MRARGACGPACEVAGEGIGSITLILVEDCAMYEVQWIKYGVSCILMYTKGVGPGFQC